MISSERGCPALDWHSGANTPGQHWSAYRSRALTESQAEKIGRPIGRSLDAEHVTSSAPECAQATGELVLSLSEVQAKEDERIRVARQWEDAQWRPLSFVCLYQQLEREERAQGQRAGTGKQKPSSRKRPGQGRAERTRSRSRGRSRMEVGFQQSLVRRNLASYSLECLVCRLLVFGSLVLS